MKIATIIWSILCVLFAVIILPNSGYEERDASYYQKMCKESGAVSQKHEDYSYYEGGIGEYCDMAVIMARSTTPDDAMDQFRRNHINVVPFEVKKIDDKILLTKGVKDSIDFFMIVIMFFVWFIPLALLAGVVKTLRFLTRK